MGRGGGLRKKSLEEAPLLQLALRIEGERPQYRLEEILDWPVERICLYASWFLLEAEREKAAYEKTAAENAAKTRQQ